MARLNWISDNNLKSAVSHLLLKAKEAKITAEEEVNKNVTDPFSAIFEMSGFGMSFQTWILSEKARQAQKTLQNHLGDFHQKILGSVIGWKNMETGNVIDLVSEKDKIIAEVKNKHNTISGGKLADLYRSLDGLVMPKFSNFKGYTAYYVAIIPKSPTRFNSPFAPPDKETGEKCSSNDKIRQIDGASFYSLVTGEENALENLFEVLPEIISECTNGSTVITDKEFLRQFFDWAYLKKPSKQKGDRKRK